MAATEAPTAAAIRPPEDVPGEIFEAALTTFLDCRRLDMRALAVELGMGRATLYRKVGNRDQLLGAVVWFLARHLIAEADRATSGERGGERVAAAAEHFMRGVSERPELRHLLEAEPEVALRVLTSKHGPVQQGLVTALDDVIADEVERGELHLTVDRTTLAYALVRIGESFLYADAIADGEPDVEAAVELVRRLMRAA